MKIALICDTHWGVRGDNIAFLDNNKKFLDNVFFPTIDENKIETIIHLGDLVDRRKYINIQTAKRLREDFIDPIAKLGIDYHQILGNHDIFFKNTTSVNAVQELCCPGMDSPRFHVYDKATEVIFDDTKFLFVPWICAENKDDTFEKINNTTAQICLGHLELRGFQMFKGNVSTHGDDANIFSQKFDITCSGHYHHRSNDAGVHYLGSHGQFTWSDYGDSRGFHILDTKTRELTFIENPYRMFMKAFYDDSNCTSDELLNCDFSAFNGVLRKIVVRNKTNPYWFDMFCEKVEKAGALDIQIVEDHLNLDLQEESDIAEDIENTIDIFRNHINDISGSVNKQKLEDVMINLYREAATLE